MNTGHRVSGEPIDFRFLIRTCGETRFTWQHALLHLYDPKQVFQCFCTVCDGVDGTDRFLAAFLITKAHSNNLLSIDRTRSVHSIASTHLLCSAMLRCRQIEAEALILRSASTFSVNAQGPRIHSRDDRERSDGNILHNWKTIQASKCITMHSSLVAARWCDNVDPVPRISDVPYSTITGT